MLFLTACWVLLLNPRFYQENWVKSSIFDVKKLKENAPSQVLPIMPENML